MATGPVYLYNIVATGQPNEFTLELAVNPGQRFYKYDKFISPSQQVLEIVSDPPPNNISAGVLTVKLLNVNTTVPSSVAAATYFAIEHTPKHKLGQARTLTALMSNIDKYVTYLNANKYLIDNIVPTNYEILEKLGYDDISNELLVDGDPLAKKTELHEHDNKSVLDKITEDIDGKPLWDGSEWPGGSGTGDGDMLKAIYDADNDGKVDLANVADKVDWTGVQNKPATYPPSAHTHGISDIIGLTTHINNLTDLMNNAMLKDDYDNNANGIVDRAEVADAVDWDNITNKPTDLADGHNHSNKDALDLITKDASNNPLWDGAAWPGGSGSGDMLKATYDTTNSGIVDKAETLEGLLATITELNFVEGVTSNIQIQLNDKQDTSEKSQANGYASLDVNSKVPLNELYPHTLVVADIAARDALVATVSDVEGLRVYVQDTSEEFIRHSSSWLLLQSSTSSVDWDDINNKPTSTVSDIDDAVDKKHTHSNITILNNTTASFTSALKLVYDGYSTSKQNVSEKGNADGYASLDSNGKVPLNQLPDSTKGQTYVVLDTTERNTLNTVDLLAGDKCYETSTGDSYIWDGSSWVVLAKADWENINLDWANIDNRPTSTVSDIDDAVSKKHTHSNKTLLDSYNQTNADLTDAVSKKHEHSNTLVLDALTQQHLDDSHAHSNSTVLDKLSEVSGELFYDGSSIGLSSVDWADVLNRPTSTVSDIDDAVSKKHDHSNKTLLDSYNQTNVDLTDAVSKKHEHSNTSVLDALTQQHLDDSHTHSNEAALNLIDKDIDDKPTWNGSAWPDTGVEDHTLLTNQNGDEEYLHITRAEKDKYDGYEALINDLISRINVIEQNMDVIHPVEFGEPSTHQQIDIPVNSVTYVDIPLTKFNDVTYIIEQSNIVTSPNNIISGSVSIIDVGEDKFLRVPVNPTLYNEEYTITVNPNAISYNGIGNNETTSTTFTTIAADEVVITNNAIDGQTDVNNSDFVLTYDLTTNNPGSIITLNDVGAISVTGADVGSITISGGQLRIPLSNMDYETLVTVTIGAGAISNSGTLNTTVVTTTFTTWEDSGSPYLWEYEYRLTTGVAEIKLDQPFSGTFTDTFTIEEFYGAAYDGVDKTVEVLWFGYVGNILHPDGSPIATSVETWTHESPDGKVDYDGMNTINFSMGSGDIRIYKVVKHKTPITRS